MAAIVAAAVVALVAAGWSPTWLVVAGLIALGVVVLSVVGDAVNVLWIRRKLARRGRSEDE